MVSAMSQSSGVSRSIARFGSVAHISRRLKLPMGMRRSDSGFIDRKSVV